MNRKSSKSIISIGTTSIVLIFVLLCLLTFSVLSLVSAKANLSLSQKSADRTAAYYDAENQANEVLFTIIDCLDETVSGNPGITDAEFYETVHSRLNGEDGIVFTDDQYLEYQVPLTDEQFLHVGLEISHVAFSDGKHYRILAWNTCSTHEWTPDDSLPLLDEKLLSDMITED